MSKVPSFINVTQEEWDDHVNGTKKIRIEALKQEYNLTQEEAEKRYDELPI